MITHRIRRNNKFQIPLDADKIVKATLGDIDISDKYKTDCRCFDLGHDDTADLCDCLLELEYEQAGETKAETHRVEVTTNGG